MKGCRQTWSLPHTSCVVLGETLTSLGLFPPPTVGIIISITNVVWIKCVKSLGQHIESPQLNY